MTERIDKAVEAARGGAESYYSDAALDGWPSEPAIERAVKAALEALAADGPVAVLPGGEVVGMKFYKTHYEVVKGPPLIPQLDEHIPVALYRLVADEEDGDE